MNRFFRIFLHKSVRQSLLVYGVLCVPGRYTYCGLGSLHYYSSRSDFGFEFVEIFLFEKRLPVSTIRGVANSAYQWYRNVDTGSRYLEKKISLARKSASLPCPFNGMDIEAKLSDRKLRYWCFFRYQSEANSFDGLKIDFEAKRTCLY